MKKGFISILLLSLFIECTAQFIINTPVDNAISDLHFNPEFISKNKIKKIDVIISDKPDGSIILNKGAGIVYKFNELGYITRYQYTILNKKEIVETDQPVSKTKGKNAKPTNTIPQIQYVNDTINVYGFYDINNHIIAKRTRIGDLFRTYYYEYNAQKQIRKESHYQETNISINKKEFKLGEQKIIFADIFEYTKLTNIQIKKKTLNDNLIVYKKAIINYDEQKNKISENSEFVVSCIRQEKAYEYDKNSRLLKQTYISTENGELKLESTFEYDKIGNLISEKKFKNRNLIFEIHYIYDVTNTFIKSEVDRDYLNSTVIIKKYEYSFYE